MCWKIELFVHGVLTAVDDDSDPNCANNDEFVAFFDYADESKAYFTSDDSSGYSGHFTFEEDASAPEITLTSVSVL